MMSVSHPQQIDSRVLGRNQDLGDRDVRMKTWKTYRSIKPDLDFREKGAIRAPVW